MVDTLGPSRAAVTAVTATRATSCKAPSTRSKVHVTAAARRSASLVHDSREKLRDEVRVAAWLTSRDLRPSTAASAAQRLEGLRARLSLKG